MGPGLKLKKSESSTFISEDSCASGSSTQSSFEPVASLKGSTKSGTTEIEYNDCGKSFKTGTQLENHETKCKLMKNIKDVSVVVVDGKIKFMCKTCNNTFNHLTRLEKHEARHKTPGEFKCRYCSHQFTNIKDRNNHINIEHMTFKCSICNAIFLEAKEYERHVRYEHEGKDKNSTICTDCGAVIRSSFQLKLHLESKCGTIKSYQCNQCDSKFMNVYTLAQHKLIHTGEKKFLCNHCGKSFLSKGQLTVHERSHTKEKPFTCKVCNKSFAHRESIVTHSSIHTGVKPYQCECCNKQFSCVGNLVQHRRTRPNTCGSKEYETHRNMVAPRAKTKNANFMKCYLGPSKTKSPRKHYAGKTSIAKDTKTLISALEHLDNPNNKAEKNVTNDSVHSSKDNNNNNSTNSTTQKTPSKMENSYEIAYIQSTIPETTVQVLVDEHFNKTLDFVTIHIEDITQEQSNELSLLPDAELTTDKCEIGGSNLQLTQKSYVPITFVSVKQDDVQKDNGTYINSTVQREVIKNKLVETHDGNSSNMVSGHDDSSSSSIIDAIIEYDCEEYEQQQNKQSNDGIEITIDSNDGVDGIVKVDKDGLFCEYYNSTYNKIEIRCKQCPSIYSSNKPLINHYQKVHNHIFSIDELNEISNTNRRKLRKPRTRKTKPMVECHYCKKSYSSLKRLQTHMNIHGSDDEPLIHKCICCKKHFKTSDILNDHMQSQHNDELTCDKCDKKFKNRNGLNAHMSYLHSSSRLIKLYTFVCPNCGRKFSTKTSLTDHERSNCGSIPIYNCVVCNKSYHSAGSLKGHMTLHSGELPFLCNFCGKAFRTRGQVKIHSRRHTGLKPFKCQHCLKTFAHRETLVTHESLHTGLKRFMCSACGMRFSCISNLKAHRKSHKNTCGKTPIVTKAIGPMDLTEVTDGFS